MLKDQKPTDSMDDIIDLTEIVQKGKPPRSTHKEVVDFDSALSDLMVKAPESTMKDNPQLEELLSGIDEVAHERRGREARKTDNDMDDSGAEDDNFLQVDNADDMDSLLSSIDGPHKPVPQTRKEQQPVEDVDSLLDSLMDDIDPPASGTGRDMRQEISEADLDDLLDTIEQESTGKAPTSQEATQEVPMDSLDDLLSSLDDLPKVKKAPAAVPVKSLETEVPIDSLEDLFSSVDAPAKKAPAKAPAKASEQSSAGRQSGEIAPEAVKTQEATEIPASLDDLLGDLFPTSTPAPKPASEFVLPEPPASLDDLLAGILPPAPRPKAGADSLDDLLGDVVPSAERRSLDVKLPVEPKLAEALGNLGGLLADLPPKPAGKAAAPVEAKAPAPDADSNSGDDEGDILENFIEIGGMESLDEVDSLLDGLDDPAPEPTPLPDNIPSSENFGDMANMFASETEAGTEAEDDDLVYTEGTSFTAEDMSGLDSMFGTSNEVEDSQPEALSAAMQASPRRPEAAEQPVKAQAPVDPFAAPVDPFATPAEVAEIAEIAEIAEVAEVTEIAEVAEVTPAAFAPVFIPLAERAQPPQPDTLSSPIPPVTAQASQAETSDMQEMQRRMAMLEAELHALQSRVHTLETANAMEMRQEQVSAMLEEGSPLSNRLTELMRMAISQEINVLNDQGERQADSVAELESRTEALEVALAATEAAIVPEPRVAELESRTEAVESGLVRVDLLESRTNALETTLTRVAAQADSATAQPDHTLRADLGSLESRVNSLEESTQISADPQESLQQLNERLATLETRPYVPMETIQDAFDQMGAQLNKPLQQFQNRIITLESRLNSELPQLAGELAPHMTEYIGRAAAESAARALREELAALMADAGNADDVDVDDADADEFTDPQV